MEALESAWLDERVLESNDLLVVDKPVHLPVHGGADVPGSVTTRLTEYLGCRGETNPRLGVHQRLDQETSGVLLFTRTPELDSQIAAAFRERRLSRVYSAVVEGDLVGDGRLECRLAPLNRGRVRVVRDGGKARPNMVQGDPPKRVASVARATPGNWTHSPIAGAARSRWCAYRWRQDVWRRARPPLVATRAATRNPWSPLRVAQAPGLRRRLAR